MKKYRIYTVLLLMLWVSSILAGTQFKHPYTEENPLIIVGDWDKPPYEYQNDKGHPVGMNIDVMDAIMKQLDIPYRYVLKEWSNALKTFEHGEADLILANYRRYRKGGYAVSHNAINYNRICVASREEHASDSVIPLSRLRQEGVVLKWGDYTSFFFNGTDSTDGKRARVEYQSPKVALTGLADGDNKYFVWGEEPLKWKIKVLNLTGIVLSEVAIPISEIHVIGRDKKLIEAIDDYYSRLKQSGEIERLQGQWLHPELVASHRTPMAVVIVLSALLLLVLFYAVHWLTRTRVKRAISNSEDLNNMMFKALQMGDYLVVYYDIRRNLMTNGYGKILPEEGVTLEDFSRRIHPNEQEDFNRRMGQLCSGRQKNAEMLIRWNKGTDEQPQWLCLEGHAIVETDTGGNPTNIIKAFHNVTHDVENLQALYEQERKYDALFHLPSIALSFYDKDGYLTDLNQQMKELCGFDNPDSERFWRKMNIFDIPAFRNAYSADSVDDLLACQRMEYRDLGINRYIEFNVHPIMNHAEQLMDYFICSIDITDDRTRDQDLHNREKAILATNEQIAILEKRLNYLLVNCKMFVWRLTLASQQIHFSRSLLHPEFSVSVQEYLSCMDESQRPEAAAMLTDVSRLEQPLTLRHRFLYNPLSEEPRWYSIVSVPTHDADGKLTGCFGLVRDITKLLDVQRRLREETARAQDSGRQKSVFLASMTHELRTPLNSIVGFSDLLRTVDNAEDRREFIRIIRNNCDMLLRLINDILEVSSLNDGQQSVTPVSVDFATAFDDICQSLEQRVQIPEVTFLKDNPYEHYYTVIDIGRVQQVITNFVTNAVKYTVKGHIKVGYCKKQMVRKDGWEAQDGLYIYCEDTGAGIPEEKQNSVFERFVKLNDFVQGTGLGLAICKSIAERCGGHIGIDSKGEGHGSTFWIWIPCERTEKQS